MEKHVDQKTEDADFMFRCHGCKTSRQFGKNQFECFKKARQHHNRTQHSVEVCKITTIDWFHPGTTRVIGDTSLPF